MLNKFELPVTHKEISQIAPTKAMSSDKQNCKTKYSLQDARKVAKAVSANIVPVLLTG